MIRPLLLLRLNDVPTHLVTMCERGSVSLVAVNLVRRCDMIFHYDFLRSKSSCSYQRVF